VDAERAAESKTTTERRDAEVKIIARLTDGKCAAEITGEDGTARLVTLSGRMDMDTVTEIAAMIPGASVVPVGKSAGALAPKEGTASLDAGTNDVGVCPVCAKEVRLTASGAIGTHRPSGETPSGPKLTQRSVPAINDKGEPERDAQKKRDAEAYVDELAVDVDDMAAPGVVAAAVLAAVKGDAEAENVKAVRTPVVPVTESGLSPVGVRDHGQSDGVAMLPIGESGYAGVKFDDGGSFDLDGKPVEAEGVLVSDIKGGWFGHLTEDEYLALSKNARRRYRAKVAERQAKWREGGAARREAKIAKGELIPAVERRERKVAAKLGRRNEGQTHSHHVDARPVDVTVYGGVNGQGAARIGRDHV
jgi:hypothetical protein